MCRFKGCTPVVHPFFVPLPEIVTLLRQGRAVKIVTDTPDRLVLEYRPWMLSLGLAGLCVFMMWVALDAWNSGDKGTAGLVLVIIAGLLGPALWFATERVQVVFDRREGHCILRRKRLTGCHTESHPLARITRAMVQTHKGGQDDPDSHRVALVIGPDSLENRHGLTRSYRSGNGADETVSRVNAWLDSVRQQA